MSPRRPGVVLLALAGLLAGCLAPAESALTPGGLLDGVVAPLVARANTIVDPEGGLGEPSVGVLPDGTIFVNGRDWEAPGIPIPGRGTYRLDSGAVFRSSDGGATFEKVGAPTRPWPNLDPDLVVDKDGTIWYDILWVGCVTVATSRDAGESWSLANPLACSVPVGDRQYVIPTRGGEAYVYFHQLPTWHQTGAKTTDYGRTWIPTGPMETPDHHLFVNGGSGWGGGGFWNEATGSVFATYTWFEEGFQTSRPPRDWSPAASVTRNGGLTWEVTKAATAGGESMGLSLVVGAADDAGTVYLAWAEWFPDANSTGVFLASSTDDGKTWSAPKRVDDARPGSRLYPAIAATAPGKVAVAYYETPTPGHPYQMEEEGVFWNVTLAWTSDATSAAPAWERGQLSAQPAKEGPICPNGTGCRGHRQLLDYFTIKPTPDGRVVGVWTSTVALEDKTVNVVAVTDDAPLARP